jgi:hypothetical protein
MVGHHNPGMQSMSLTIKIQERTFDYLSHGRSGQPYHSRPRVKIFFDSPPALSFSLTQRQSIQLQDPLSKL